MFSHQIDIQISEAMINQIIFAYHPFSFFNPCPHKSSRSIDRRRYNYKYFGHSQSMNSSTQEKPPMVRFSYNGVQGGTVTSPPLRQTQPYSFPSTNPNIQLATSTLVEGTYEGHGTPLQGKAEPVKFIGDGSQV